MPEMNRGWWIAAIAAVLVPLAARAETDPKTVRTFKAKCASCHGADGKGKTDQGQKMKLSDLTDPAVQKKSDADFKKVISDGVKTEKGGVKQEMEGYKDSLTPEQIDQLVAYIRTLK
jgi:mono/diheme cytochrome c family protein